MNAVWLGSSSVVAWFSAELSVLLNVWNASYPAVHFHGIANEIGQRQPTGWFG